MNRATRRKSSGIRWPILLIEIDGQKEAGFVAQQRVNAHDEVVPSLILSREMQADDLRGDGQKTLMQTSRALNPGLLADARQPLVTTRGRVTRFPRLATYEPPGIDILTTPKKLAKQSNFGLGRGQVIHVPVWSVHAGRFSKTLRHDRTEKDSKSHHF